MTTTARIPDLGWAFEEWKTHKNYAFYGPAVRTAFVDGARWVLGRLGEWESLTEGEAITELRKGESSVFYPLFRDEMSVWADCPNHGRVTVRAEGYCDGCGFDFCR